MNLKRILITSLFLGSAAVFANPVMAQAGPGVGPGKADRAEFQQKRHAKMVEMRGRMLREKVGLSEATAKKAESVLAEYDKKHQTTRVNVRDAHQKLAKLVASNSTNNAEYTKLIKALRAAHDSMHSIRKAQFDALAKVLSPKEQAKLLLELGHMKKRFHSGKGRGGKGRPGWGQGAGKSQCDGRGPGRPDKAPMTK